MTLRILFSFGYICEKLLLGLLGILKYNAVEILTHLKINNLFFTGVNF